MQTGANNLITDISGLRVGNAEDRKLKSGVTCLIADQDNVASCHVMGGAPGTRDTDLLSPENTVQSVNAIILAGGSAFGLDACGGAQAKLREDGRGFEVGDLRVPIVPGAILFDLINGGDKGWHRLSPYAELGYHAAANGSVDFELGSIGAGTGALTGGPNPGLKGGLGSASFKLPTGHLVGALVAVNALGSPVVGEGPNFHAAHFEIGDEFGGLGGSRAKSGEAAALRIKFRQQQGQNRNTTIGIIATDAKLTKGEAKRLAIAAHGGLARALWPSHTPMDGDIVFSIATGTKGPFDNFDNMIDLSAAAASTMARAVARGIYSAHSEDNDLFPTWQQKFG